MPSQISVGGSSSIRLIRIHSLLGKLEGEILLIAMLALERRNLRKAFWMANFSKVIQLAFTFLAHGLRSIRIIFPLYYSLMNLVVDDQCLVFYDALGLPKKFRGFTRFTVK